MLSDLGPTLTTERLILRPPRAEDFEPMAAFVADEDSMRYMGGVQPRAVAWRAFMTIVGAWYMQGFAMFMAIERSSGLWVGRLGPWQPEGWPGTEIGWSVAPQFRGCGYATEGANASMDWAFERLGWTDVIHSIHPDNRASEGVAKRLGSQLRGPSPLPPPYENSPNNIWGQTREQWRARRGMAA